MFRLIPFRLSPFVLIGTFAGVAAIAAGAFFAFPFIPHQFQPRTIEQQKLSAARDLKGTFEGAITFMESNTTSGTDYCKHSYSMRMIIENLTNTKISGTLAFKFESITGRCSSNETNVWGNPVAFTASISGSKITRLDLGALQGVFSGSFTTDTITLNQNTPGRYDIGASQGTYTAKTPVNLLRK